MTRQEITRAYLAFIEKATDRVIASDFRFLAHQHYGIVAIADHKTQKGVLRVVFADKFVAYLPTLK